MMLTEQIARSERLVKLAADHGIDPTTVIDGSDKVRREYSLRYLAVTVEVKITDAEVDYLEYGIEPKEAPDAV